MKELQTVCTYNGYHYQYEAVRTETKFITCQHCKHTIVVDYSVLIDFSAGATAYVRNVDGKQITMESDDLYTTCTACGNSNLKKSSLKATESKKHLCNDECLNAVTPVCKCSCGGLNHGHNNRHH